MRLISKKKIEAVLKNLEERGCSASLFINNEPIVDSNIQYLTGLGGMLDGTMLLSREGIVLFTSGIDYDRAVLEKNIDEVIKVKRTDNFKKMVNEKIPKKGKIGINKSLFSLAMQEKLKIPRKRLVNVSKMMRTIRAVKEGKEIEALKKSADICNNGLKFLQDFIKSGIKTGIVSSELERELKSAGSERTPFDIIVTSGKDSSIVHPYPSSGNKIIRKGLGLVDFGAVYNGYVTDVTVPFVIGNPTSQESNILDKLSLLCSDILKNVKVGMHTDKLSEIYYKGLKKYNFEIRHSLGHGIGLETHDSPSLNENGILKKNMVIAVEPGIYVNGVGGTRLENDYLVKGKSSVALTKSKLIRI